MTSDTTPTFVGTAEAGTTVELFAAGNSLGTTSSDSDGNWSFTVPNKAALSDGGISVTAIATGTAGNSSKSSPALNLTIDTVAPEFSSTGTAAAVDENSGAGQVIYTASTTDTSSVTYSLKADNNDDAASVSINSSTGEVTLNIDPDYESQSNYDFTVVAADLAGNDSEQIVALAINDLTEQSLSIPNLSIQAGKSVSIPINISDAAGIESLDLNLTYDPAVFSAPKTTSLITAGSLNPGAAFVVNDSSPGQLLLSWSGTNPLSSGSGSIATLNLDVKPDASLAPALFSIWSLLPSMKDGFHLS